MVRRGIDFQLALLSLAETELGLLCDLLLGRDR